MASSARAATTRSGPCGRTSAGAMHTSQANAPHARTSPRWSGTCPSRCGAKHAPAVTKVRTMFPGGPIRDASHSTFWAAASSAATSTSSAAEPVREAAVSATPTPAVMPRTRTASAPARAAYGRAWP
ncbi:hypothetical protein SMD11_0788 [Streptomyces albireticuli]|uniref:Uncharacterized protein n=1 Tax=Streptomyces albireticuli TaxID=1940 RepID=A0A1Z2KWM8_9ACTN|nr:hypothetical protein [Streptomyces albireticuli]ARZ66454.1 hypothetical protein SMD11_0788 [Streptomyces albireticuli]